MMVRSFRKSFVECNTLNKVKRILKSCNKTLKRLGKKKMIAPPGKDGEEAGKGLGARCNTIF